VPRIKTSSLWRRASLSNDVAVAASAYEVSTESEMYFMMRADYTEVEAGAKPLGKSGPRRSSSEPGFWEMIRSMP